MTVTTFLHPRNPYTRRKGPAPDLALQLSCLMVREAQRSQSQQQTGCHLFAKRSPWNQMNIHSSHLSHLAQKASCTMLCNKSVIKRACMVDMSNSMHQWDGVSLYGYPTLLQVLPSTEKISLQTGHHSHSDLPSNNVNKLLLVKLLIATIIFTQSILSNFSMHIKYVYLSVTSNLLLYPLGCATSWFSAFRYWTDSGKTGAKNRVYFNDLSLPRVKTEEVRSPLQVQLEQTNETKFITVSNSACIE